MIYDISRPLTPSLAVWPGDRPFSFQWSARISRESPVNVGAFSMSTHAGTHVDAPLHYLGGGEPVEAYPLACFVGRAQVVSVVGDAIRPEHLQGCEPGVERVLFKTESSYVPDHVWEPSFVPLLQNTILHAQKTGILLLGTDAPSVDPADSKALPAHHALAAAGIANLENLLLRDVPDGVYWLCALPLSLPGADAAPVRAALLSLDAVG